MKKIKHPWQSGPVELCEYAQSLLIKESEVENRISFLLFDVLTETVFKTYLTLPDSLTRAKLPFSKRKEHTSGNFHKLIDGIKKCTSLVSSKDLAHVEFYHDIRNKLYHQGNGITVNRKDLVGYSKLSISILKKLLKIDASLSSKNKEEQKKYISDEQRKTLNKALQNVLNDINFLSRLLIEKTEPMLLFPSTLTVFRSISNKIEMSNFLKKIIEFREIIEKVISNEELKKWLLSLISDDLNWDSPQEIDNTKFIIDKLSDPIEFYLFLLGSQFFPIDNITMNCIDRYDDISFIEQDDYHIMGVYTSIVFIKKWIESNDKNEYWVLNRGQELVEKAQVIIKSMESKLSEFDNS